MVGGSGRRELSRLLLRSLFLVSVEDCLQGVSAEVATADEPFDVLLDDDTGGEPDRQSGSTAARIDGPESR
jgi:hypothetical protein